MKIPKLIKRQHQTGPYWGAIKLSYQQSIPYLTLWNFVMITVTAYNTTVRDWLSEHGIESEAWQLVPFGIIILLVMILAEYRFSMPSVYRFTWDQGYGHSTLLKHDINSIKSDIIELKQEIKNLNDRAI